VALGSGVGVSVGVGVGVGVGVSVGVAVGTGVGVALGEGVGDPVIRSHTASRGLICDALSMVEFVGSVNVGMVSPPESIADVPVGDTKTMFELTAVAVEAVHGSSQKTVGLSTGAIAPQVPELA